jgi:hypothetical protein
MEHINLAAKVHFTNYVEENTVEKQITVEK